MNRVRTALLAATALAAVVFGVQWWRVRSAGSPSSDRAAIVSDLTRRAVKAYAGIEVIPLLSLTGVGEIEALLQGAHQAGSPGAADVPLLIRTAAEFIHLRLLVGSLDAYKTWRVQQGYEHVSRAEMVEVLGARESFRSCADTEVPPELSASDIFDQLWSMCEERFGSAARVVRIADDSRGLVILYGRTEAGRPRAALVPNAELQAQPGGIAAELWLGGGAGATQPYWRLAESTNDMVARCGSTTYAEVGIVVEFESGSRHPLGVVFVWDPFVRIWRLEGIMVYNATDPGSGLGVY